LFFTLYICSHFFSAWRSGIPPASADGFLYVYIYMLACKMASLFHLIFLAPREGPVGGGGDVVV